MLSIKISSKFPNLIPGQIYYNNFPNCAQMLGGLHTDNGVQSRKPPNFIKIKATKLIV